VSCFIFIRRNRDCIDAANDSVWLHQAGRVALLTKVFRVLLPPSPSPPSLQMSTAVRRDGSDLLPGRGAPRNRPVHINQNNPSPPKQATPNYNRSPLQPLNASEQSPQSHPYYNQAKQQSEYLHRTLRQQEAELEAREEQQR
jgi:hypothetical protein